jgi:hypothetical protein
MNRLIFAHHCQGAATCFRRFFLFLSTSKARNLFEIFVLFTIVVFCSKLLSLQHLVDKVACSSVSINYEEQITNIERDIAADACIVAHIAHHAIPCTVEVWRAKR